uniref:Pyridoxamine 5'-phosphate oxidase n=2 Tax=Mycobacterium riyadhense TaxID=486698 RepID=A0A653ET64_9MYCO|nr:Pyridoxamine 5'-phosphate oxidase [Mycobacterium riyadhense]
MSGFANSSGQFISGLFNADTITAGVTETFNSGIGNLGNQVMGLFNAQNQESASSTDRYAQTMAKQFSRIDESLREFIQAQAVFFVATAPSQGGRVNLSPKGYRDTFVVLDDHTVAYLDLFGSGVETIAHLRDNGRITIMFCSFTRNSRILRLSETGRAVRPDNAEFERIRTYFGTLHPGVRAAIVVDVERIADACGYAVPYYELVDERPVLDAYHTKADEEAYVRLVERNRKSIDGLPALDADHPLPPSV